MSNLKAEQGDADTKTRVTTPLCGLPVLPDVRNLSDAAISKPLAEQGRLPILYQHIDADQPERALAWLQEHHRVIHQANVPGILWETLKRGDSMQPVAQAMIGFGLSSEEDYKALAATHRKEDEDSFEE